MGRWLKPDRGMTQNVPPMEKTMTDFEETLTFSVTVSDIFSNSGNYYWYDKQLLCPELNMHSFAWLMLPCTEYVYVFKLNTLSPHLHELGLLFDLTFPWCLWVIPCISLFVWHMKQLTLQLVMTSHMYLRVILCIPITLFIWKKGCDQALWLVWPTCKHCSDFTAYTST